MNTDTQVTQDQADEIILNSDYEFILDGEYEFFPGIGHQYGLDNGETVFVTLTGEVVSGVMMEQRGLI